MSARVDPHGFGGMLGVASQIGDQVIAEGVETSDELRVLLDLGFELAQGYYLGRPGSLLTKLRLAEPPAP